MIERTSKQKEIPKLVLIDDDEEYALTFSERLGLFGFEVHAFSSHPPNLIDFISLNKVSLVILDLAMPKTNGREILSQIRKKFEKNEVPVIVATGLDDSSIMSELFKIGANDYITKPIPVGVAAARIFAHLAAAEKNKEAIALKQLEAVKALICTYSHEINNPLSIAMAESARIKKRLDSPNEIQKLESSLDRISDILKQIEKVGQSCSLNFEAYASSTKMIKLK